MAEEPAPGLSLRYSDRARRSLNQIWWDTASRWSEAQADRYVAFLRAKISTLLTFPTLGSPVDGRPGYRSLTLRKSSGGDGHVVLYAIQPAEGVLEFLELFHTKQNWPEQI
jgi:plasmid stabilization system protein ParE